MLLIINSWHWNAKWSAFTNNLVFTSISPSMQFNRVNVIPGHIYADIYIEVVLWLLCDFIKSDRYAFAVDSRQGTVYPKKYAHGFCFAVLCCGYTLTDVPISTRLTSLALWQSNDCPSASKATEMKMDKYFMWIHYERLGNHNKAKHNKAVCIFLGIYCNGICQIRPPRFRFSQSNNHDKEW